MPNDTPLDRPYTGRAWLVAREAVRVELEWAIAEGWAPHDIAAHMLHSFPEIVDHYRKAR